MQTNISKWGNSLGVRIPGALAEQLGISAGASVEIFIEDNQIIIRKVQKLESLVAQITADNLHTEIETGKPKGKEVW